MERRADYTLAADCSDLPAESLTNRKINSNTAYFYSFSGEALGKALQKDVFGQVDTDKHHFAIALLARNPRGA